MANLMAVQVRVEGHDIRPLAPLCRPLAVHDLWCGEAEAAGGLEGLVRSREQDVELRTPHTHITRSRRIPLCRRGQRPGGSSGV